MKLEEQNVLFFTRTMKSGGTENVIMQLCEIVHPLANKIVVCSCGGINVEVLQKMGIKHYSIPDIEEKSPRTMLRVVRTLVQVVKNEKITVIHTHHRMAAFYVSILRLYKKCVFLHTVHGFFFNKKLLTRFAYKHARMVACGEMVKQNMIEVYDIPKQKIVVCQNAVRDFKGEIVPIDSIVRNKEKFRVANIGRLSEEKGPEYFVRAIPVIIDNYQDVHFYLVGTGEQENYLKDIVRDLNIEQYVTFMGYRSDVQNIIAQMDLMVLSSLTEGLPLSPIETFSMGKTIVVTGVPGTLEIVSDGENGIVVPLQNANAIAHAVIDLYENREKKRRLEIRAKETYNEKFSYDAFARKYIGVYESV